MDFLIFFYFSQDLGKQNQLKYLTTNSSVHRCSYTAKFVYFVSAGVALEHLCLQKQGEK